MNFCIAIAYLINFTHEFLSFETMKKPHGDMKFPQKRIPFQNV